MSDLFPEPQRDPRIFPRPADELESRWDRVDGMDAVLDFLEERLPPEDFDEVIVLLDLCAEQLKPSPVFSGKVQVT